jgi:hypothetical protein
MSHFGSMSHTSPLGYPHLLETRSILEVYGQKGESSGSGEFRTVSVEDIPCPVESIVEPVESAMESVVVSVQPVVESVPAVESAVMPA